MTISAHIMLGMTAVTLALGLWTAAIFIDESQRRRFLLEAMWEQDAGGGRRRRVVRALYGAPGMRSLATRLASAGLTWSPVTVAGSLLAVMGTIIVGGYPLLGRLASLLLAFLVPAMFLRWMKRKAARRQEDFIAQLPELARILANGNSAGLAIGRGIAMAGREMADPAGEEMRRVSQRLDLGWSVDRALDDLAARLPSREVNVLVRTIVLQARTGGALTEALLDISTALEDRKELRREVATVILGSAVSGYAVMLIAAGSVIILNVIEPGLLDLMMTKLVGQIVLLVTVALFALGAFVMKIVSRVEV